MSCSNSEKNRVGREEGEQEQNQHVLRGSVEKESRAVVKNGSITAPQLTIDRSLLVDPKLLFIGSKIGEGAHGKVYEGRYGDRIVAIKVLNRGSTSDERALLEDRFIREVNMMSRVKHDNLVKFLGACKDPLMVIVTELLPGMSLRKYLVSLRPNKLDLHVALNFALDIARAMDCLHANGIIHRDLKPDNLLLTPDQKSLKLADFGLAREETVTEMMTAETGTYRWMAPEEKLSLAFIYCIRETKDLPVLYTNFSRPMHARPGLPEDISPDLAFIVQSCWVEDPNLRPSFSQIIRMLNAFLFTLRPPSPSVPESDTNEAAATSNGAMTEFSARARGKFAFLRQLFTAKRTKNLQ
ncbi:hypothetical protein CUMW_001270 [Citrus unshiu]|nr:hypothetical protein CUMW_001270 [Citrus unshiu]GAY32233.1 hypothetical protein CUMW_001270 [Citrus unshiu]